TVRTIEPGDSPRVRAAHAPLGGEAGRRRGLDGRDRARAGSRGRNVLDSREACEVALRPMTPVGRPAMGIYYGWWIVASSVVVLTLLLGSTYHAFGVFVLPVSEDFGLSRAQTNTALILFSIGNAIWAPIVGQMLDRLPIRPIMLSGALLIGASLVALGYSHSA